MIYFVWILISLTVYVKIFSLAVAEIKGEEFGFFANPISILLLSPGFI